jgi:hypothetical protein
MEPLPPLTGARAPLAVEPPVCAARCPECGKPCLQPAKHASCDAHACQRNHRWGAAAEQQPDLKAR